MWEILKEQDEAFGIGADFTEHNLTMTMPNGARLQLFGADMKNFIRRLRGIKTPGVGVDEAQEFGSHIEQLADDVLIPTIADYKDGWIALTGTPGPIPHGFFYDITEKKKYGYSLHSWSLYENPYMPNAKEFVEDLKKRKGWSDASPTLLREWKGQWVLDLDALVIKYQKEINDYQSLPEPIAGWEFIIGVDIGFDDADAIAVIGWNPKVKASYLVEECINKKQGITELAMQIESLIRKYNPIKVVMDTGGLGKKIAEEIRRRYSIPIMPAEKERKFEFIELLNDALRTRRFFAKSTSRFVQDSSLLKWDQSSDKLKVSDNYHSDIIDAVIYAFRESLHWTYEPEPFKPRPGNKEWLNQQAKQIEEELVQRYEEEKSNEKFWESPDWEDIYK